MQVFTVCNFQLFLILVIILSFTGTNSLQFKLPGGICVDKENNVYIADEGNNRIQKISKSGECLATFCWEHNKSFVTDVAFDPSGNRLLVPRSHSVHGKKRSFSLIWFFFILKS